MRVLGLLAIVIALGYGGRDVLTRFAVFTPDSLQALQARQRVASSQPKFVPLSQYPPIEPPAAPAAGSARQD